MGKNYYSFLRNMGLIYLPMFWLRGHSPLMSCEDQISFPFELKKEYVDLLNIPITEEFIKEQMKRYNTYGGNKIWTHYFLTNIFYDREHKSFRGLLYQDSVEKDKYYVATSNDLPEEFFVPDNAELIVHNEKIEQEENHFLRLMFLTGDVNNLPFKPKKQKDDGYRCNITLKDIRGMNERLREELKDNERQFLNPDHSPAVYKKKYML